MTLSFNTTRPSQSATVRRGIGLGGHDKSLAGAAMLNGEVCYGNEQ